MIGMTGMKPCTLIKQDANMSFLSLLVLMNGDFGLGIL